MNLEFLKEDIEAIKKELNVNLESLVLFGSYARNEEKPNSDIDILLIIDKKINTKTLKNLESKINKKIELLIMTKKEFKKKVLEFNHQLITLFLDGIILYDKEKYYQKMENLFLALNRKKEFKLIFRHKIITLNKLLRKKNFI
jgi:predicted nucleotidyltransferase